MRATRWALTALGIGLWGWLAGCTTGAPAAKAPAQPPPQEAGIYYPLEPGWKWAYDVEKDGEAILAVYSVMERLGDTAIVQAGEERLAYAVLPEGVARRVRMTVGDFLLKTPIRAGASWALANGTAKVTAFGESVEVPAGVFTNCVTVDENRTDPVRLVRTTYAPGVGPIALDVQVHDPSTGKFTTALKARLRGITKPGEDPLGAAEATTPPPRR